MLPITGSIASLSGLAAVVFTLLHFLAFSMLVCDDETARARVTRVVEQAHAALVPIPATPQAGEPGWTHGESQGEGDKQESAP